MQKCVFRLLLPKTHFRLPFELPEQPKLLGVVLFGHFRRLGFLLLFPSELVEVLWTAWRCGLLRVREHPHQQPFEVSRRFPNGSLAAVQSCQVAVDLPQLHAVQEVLGCHSALAYDDLVQVEGRYAFFAASPCLSGWSALLGV